MAKSLSVLCGFEGSRGRTFVRFCEFGTKIFDRDQLFTTQMLPILEHILLTEIISERKLFTHS